MAEEINNETVGSETSTINEVENEAEQEIKEEQEDNLLDVDVINGYHDENGIHSFDERAYQPISHGWLKMIGWMFACIGFIGAISAILCLEGREGMVFFAFRVVLVIGFSYYFFDFLIKTATFLREYWRMNVIGHTIISLLIDGKRVERCFYGRKNSPIVSRYAYKQGASNTYILFPLGGWFRKIEVLGRNVSDWRVSRCPKCTWFYRLTDRNGAKVSCHQDMIAAIINCASINGIVEGYFIEQYRFWALVDAAISTVQALSEQNPADKALINIRMALAQTVKEQLGVYKEQPGVYDKRHKTLLQALKAPAAHESSQENQSAVTEKVNE